MFGAVPGCGALSVESRTQASVLVVTHPFCDEFFEEPKRLGPTHSLLEDDWVASSRKHLLKSASRGHAMSLPARRSAHFAGPQVRLRRETRRAGDTAGWSLRDPLAKGKCRTGRLWTYVRDDRPFAGTAAPAAAFFYSPDRGGVHPDTHLATYAGLMQ